MYRKLFVSLLIAALMMVLATAVVSAQEADEMAAEAPTIEAASGVVSQSVPVTLTVSVPMTDGVQTVEVPIVLTIDVKVSLGSDMTATVEVTPAITETEAMTETEEAAEEEVAEEPVAEAEEEASEQEAADEEVVEEVAEEEAAEEPVAEIEEDLAADEEAAAEEAAEEATEGDTEEMETALDEAADDEAAEEEMAEEEMAEEIDTNCTDSRSIIYTPKADDTISGTMEVYGTATHEMFRYYKLEYQAVDSETDDYAFIVDNDDKVVNGLLAVLDTTELINGDYVLRLTVVDATGNFPPQCSVPVTIQN